MPQGRQKQQREINRNPPVQEQQARTESQPATAPPTQSTAQTPAQNEKEKKYLELEDEFEKLILAEGGSSDYTVMIDELKDQVEEFEDNSTVYEFGTGIEKKLVQTEERRSEIEKKQREIEALNMPLSYRTTTLADYAASSKAILERTRNKFDEIAKANETIGSAQAYLISGQEFNKKYREQAEAYKIDGKSYPETWMLEQIETNIKQYQDERKKIRGKNADKKASADVKDKWGKDDNLIKELEKEKKENDKRHKEVKEYRDGNLEFEKNVGDVRQKIELLEKLYSDVIKTNKSNLKLGMQKLEEAQKIRVELKDRETVVKKLIDKMSKMKMSAVNVAVLTNYSGNLSKASAMEEQGYSNLGKETASYREERKREARKTLSGTETELLLDRMEEIKCRVQEQMKNYLADKAKWKWHIEGKADEIEREKRVYGDEKEDLLRTAKEEEDQLGLVEEIRVKYTREEKEPFGETGKKYEKEKAKIDKAAKYIKEFDKDGNQAPPIMQVVLHVKRLEKSGGALKREETPRNHELRDKLLNGVTSLEGTMALAAEAAWGEKAGEGTELAVGYANELQGAGTGAASDFAGGIKAFKDDKKLLESPTGMKETQAGFSALETAGSIIAAIKDVSKFFKGIKGKSSSEKLEEGLAGINIIVGAVGNALDLSNDIREIVTNNGFLPDNPVVSTVKSAVKIIGDTFGIIQSARAAKKLKKREQKLWAQKSALGKQGVWAQVDLGDRSYVKRSHLFMPGEKKAEEQRAESYTAKKSIEREIYLEHTKQRLLDKHREKWENKYRSQGKSEEEIRQETEKYAERRAERHFTRKNEALAATEVGKSASASDSVNQNIISTKVSLQKKKMHIARKSGKDSEEYKKAKEEYSRHKELEMHSEIMIAGEARNRQYNVKKDQIEDIVKESVKVIASWMKISAMPALAITGIALEIGTALYNVIKSGATKIYQKHRDNTQHFYSTENKKYRRTQMAEIMYDRMRVIGKALDEKGRMRENLTDTRARATGENLKVLKTNFYGIGMRTAPLLRTTSKDEMLDSMASAFATGGN